jgi:hypothetical protein
MSRELPRPETINAAERLLSAHAVEWRPMLGGYSTNKRSDVTKVILTAVDATG